MKERLTKRKDLISCETCDDVFCQICDRATDAITRLAEYEDAEEQGLLVRLPCKVGDKMYIIYSPFGELDKWEITSIQILFRLGHKGTDDYAAIWDKELGDRAFFTRSEAEKKLKELKGEE